MKILISKNSNGFSLVEVLVALGLISIASLTIGSGIFQSNMFFNISKQKINQHTLSNSILSNLYQREGNFPNFRTALNKSVSQIICYEKESHLTNNTLTNTEEGILVADAHLPHDLTTICATNTRIATVIIQSEKFYKINLYFFDGGKATLSSSDQFAKSRF